MNRFFDKEKNICYFIEDTKEETVAGMTAALPFMEPEIKEFTECSLEKLNELTEEEFAGRSFEPAKK